MVSQFETATGHYIDQMNYVESLMEMDGADNVPQDERDKLENAQRYQDRAKQALIRKLLRMQNGEELVDVEALKKRMRRMARVINQIAQVVRSNNLSGDKAEIVRDLLKAQPEALEDVEKIIGKRRPW